MSLSDCLPLGHSLSFSLSLFFSLRRRGGEGRRVAQFPQVTDVSYITPCGNPLGVAHSGVRTEQCDVFSVSRRRGYWVSPRQCSYPIITRRFYCSPSSPGEPADGRPNPTTRRGKKKQRKRPVPEPHPYCHPAHPNVQTLPTTTYNSPLLLSLRLFSTSLFGSILSHNLPFASPS